MEVGTSTGVGDTIGIAIAEKNGAGSATVDATGGLDSTGTESHIPHFNSGRTLG